jgi:hypothetical protein
MNLELIFYFALIARSAQRANGFPKNDEINNWPDGPKNNNRPSFTVPQGGVLGWINEGPSARKLTS